jgi:hypothetical protein
LAHIHPVLLLHIILLPINLAHLIQIRRRLVRSERAYRASKCVTRLYTLRL